MATNGRAGILKQVSDWLKLLALTVLVAEAVLVYAMSTCPASNPVKWMYPFLMVLFLALIVVGLFYDRVQSRNLAFPSDERPVIQAATARAATEWFAGWSIGKRESKYTEILALEVSDSGAVSGTRRISSEGQSEDFRVTGFAKSGFYWLCYFLEGKTGGGTILLQEFTGGKLRGVIVSADCDTGNLRARANQWIEVEKRAKFDSSWQQWLGEVSLPGGAVQPRVQNRDAEA